MPRDAPKVCRAHLVPLSQGAAMRARASGSAGEGDGQEASGGAGGHLERAPRHCPARKDCRGLIHRPPACQIWWERDRNRVVSAQVESGADPVRSPLRTKACRGPVHLHGSPRRSSCGLCASKVRAETLKATRLRHVGVPCM